MCTFPQELLRTIFLKLTARPDSMWVGPTCSPTLGLNVAVARASFVVASICSRWRTIALETTSLWLYIGIPCPKSVADCRLIHDYVATMISRSGMAPLDIHLEWEGLDNNWDTFSPHLNTILDKLASVARRWKCLSFELPPVAATLERMDMLRHSTPFLEELIACRDDCTSSNPWRTDFLIYLPHCPKLRKHRTDDCHVIWIPPRQPLAALLQLELQVVLPAEVIWDVLRLAPTLEALELDLTLEPALWMPHGWALRMVHLRHLSVHHSAGSMLAAWVPHLELPSVDTLSLYYVEDVLVVPLITAVCDTLTDLHLEESGKFNKTFVSLLTPLHRLHWLAVEACRQILPLLLHTSRTARPRS